MAKAKAYYRRKADRLMQEWGRANFEHCEVCGSPISCLHHYFPKSMAGVLRYNKDNLIPICQGCHFRHHNGSPEIHNKINELRGKEWLDKLTIAKREFIKCDTIGYYKEIIKRYEEI